MTWTNPRKLTGITVDYAVRDAADSQSLDIILGYVGSMTKTFFFPGRSLTSLLSWHSGLGNPKCILSSMIYYSEITVETPSRSHIHTLTMRFRSISLTRHPAFRQELCHHMLMQPNTVDQR